MAPLRVVVCGTDFGRVYLSALRRDRRFVLCGIVARGSSRSRECAARYGVPLYRSVAELPSDVDAGCVAVSAAINGGPGGQIAQQLLDRGMHVLQEHPLDEAELAGCLRLARRNRVVYQMNSHYIHLPAVRSFVEAGRAVRPLFVDAQASFLVLYPLLEILAKTLGSIRPFSFDSAASGPPVMRTLHGTLGGIPLLLRVQNQLDPVSRDDGAHVLQRITILGHGGNLHLSSPAGPVLWSSSFHRPEDYSRVVDISESADADIDLPVARILHPGAQSHRHVVGQEWPQAIGSALDRFCVGIAGEMDLAAEVQWQLAISRMAAQIVDALGPVEFVQVTRPEAGPAYERVTRIGRDSAADAMASELSR
jgi:thiazolinyl imide reductase